MTSADEEYLDEIKFSVFSAHQNGEDLSESEWGDDEAEEDETDEFIVDKQSALQIEETEVDAHGDHVGGTLASATLGIIKGVCIDVSTVLYIDSLIYVAQSVIWTCQSN
jgi:hypothetical protein